MITVQRILIPIDFSEPSARALAFALSIARRFDARLFVAHIVAGSPPHSSLPEAGALRQTLHEAAFSDLSEFIRKVCDGEHTPELIVRHGEINAELRRIINDYEIDLIVMGTHGRQHLTRYFLGSVTEKLLRKMPAPILTVSRAVPSGFEVNRILYATDLSNRSRRAFRFAADFCHALGAQMTVLHVVQHLDYLFAGTKSNYFRVQYGRMVKASRSRLAEFVAREKPADMKVNTLVLEGSPYQQILETARVQQQGIIVIDLDEKNAVDRPFSGATAERIVRMAEVPVLSVPDLPDSEQIRRLGGLFKRLGEKVMSPDLTVDGAFEVAIELESSEINDVYKNLTANVDGPWYIVRKKIELAVENHFDKLKAAANEFGASKEIQAKLESLASQPA
jgi:nucleotide-binding universal stress UspA family protein